MRFSPLEQSILATFVYHNSLGIALSSFDVWKYYVRCCGNREVPSLKQVLQILHSETIFPLLVEKHGFWCLREYEELLHESATRRVETGMKRRALARIGKVFRFIPFLEGVVVSGSLVYGNAHQKSDFDVLVIARHGHVWTVRLLCSIVLQVLMKRRHGVLIANRVCLNHFVSTEALTIKYESMYNAQTYIRWLPIFRKDCFRKILSANTDWMKKYIVGHQILTTYYQWQVSDKTGIAHNIVHFFESLFCGSLGVVSERFSERLQRFYIRSHHRSVRGGRVVLSDSELEFHPGSLERSVIDRCNAKFRKLGIACTWSDSGLLE